MHPCRLSEVRDANYDYWKELINLKMDKTQKAIFVCKQNCYSKVLTTTIKSNTLKLLFVFCEDKIITYRKSIYFFNIDETGNDHLSREHQHMKLQNSHLY